MRLLHVFLLLFISAIANSQLLQNAGIFIRLNQRAVDYIAELASEAIPHLFNQLNPPDANVPPAKISNTLIHNVTKPQTEISFIEGKGFRADVNFPYIRISSNLDVSVFIFEYSGSFNAELHNLKLEMELHYSHNETTGRNEINAPHCSVNHTDLIISFPPDSSLATIRNELEDQIITKLRSTFCDVAVEALKFVDEQNLEEAVSDEPAAKSDGTEFSPAELGASICKTKVTTEEAVPRFVPSTVEPINATALSWSANLSLAAPPVFRKDDVVFGIDGGATVNGAAAPGVTMPPMSLNRSVIDEQMIGIAISEYVPNTIFSHIFDHDIGHFSETLTTADLPKSLRKLGKIFCSKCYLTVTAELVEKPYMEIDKHLGARIKLVANMTVDFQGRSSMSQLLNATATMHVTLKPTIHHSRVYGDVSLTSVDLNIFEIAVSGGLAKPLEYVASTIVPRILWPQVKKRVRFAINKRGFQLPVVCGLEFEHLKLFYVDHAVVLTTDFQFDLPMFVEKFKKYLQYKASINPSLPKYLDMD